MKYDIYEKFEDDRILKLPWKSLQNKVNFFFLVEKFTNGTDRINEFFLNVFWAI